MSSQTLSHLREKPGSRRLVYQGRLLRVAEDDVTLPTGQQARREVVLHPGGMAIVPIDEEGRVVLVRQWRHALGRALWEVPAGTREPGESTLLGAQRELQEETGFTAASWHLLSSAASSPGVISEVLDTYLATDLTVGTSRPDDGEAFDVGHFDASSIRQFIVGGDIDLKTIAGLALVGWSLVFP